MAEELSRRAFVKGAGGVGGAVTAASLGLGSVLGLGAQEARAAEIEFVYTCPMCGGHFASYEDLKAHMQDRHPDAAVPELAHLSINGEPYDVQIEPHWTLREALQFAVGLTGSAKEMCDRGACGSCTVLIDGRPALACTTLAVECVGHEVETVEGIAASEEWKPLVDAYVHHDAMQCGYCTPGMLAMAKYILTVDDDPSEDTIRRMLSGNICRCGTYARHVLAIQEAARVRAALAAGAQPDDAEAGTVVEQRHTDFELREAV